MNHIKTIQSTEKKAEKMLSKTEIESKEKIEIAQKKKNETLNKKEKELEEKQKTEINEQKPKLKEIYLKTIEKGEKEKEHLNQLAKKNRSQAIKYVIDQFNANKE